MRRFFYFLLAVLVLIAASVVALPFLPPSTWLANLLEPVVERGLGRQVTIDGGAKFSGLLPETRLQLNKVSLERDPDQGKAQPSLSVGEVHVGFGLWPTLRDRALALTRVELNAPELEVFLTKGSEPAPESPKPSTDKVAETGPIGSLQSVVIRDGRLVVRRDGAPPQTTEDIALKLTRQGSKPGMKADGEFRWKDQRFEVQGDLADPQTLITGKRSAVDMRVRRDATRAHFKGDIEVDRDVRLAGSVSLAGPSLRDAATIADISPPVAAGLEKFQIDGQLDVTKGRLQLTDANFSIDASRGRGDLVLDASGKLPSVKAALEFDLLDLNPYLPDGAKPAPVALESLSPRGAKPVQPGPAPGGLEVVSVKDALKLYLAKLDADPQLESIKPASRLRSWNDTPLDLSGLDAFEGDFTVKAKTIRYGSLGLKRGVLTGTVAEGRAEAKLENLDALDGQIAGDLAVDTPDQSAGVEAKIQFSGIDTEALTDMIAGRRLLSGKSSGDIQFKSAGRSARDIVSGLDGQVRLKVDNGAVLDVDRYGKWAKFASGGQSEIGFQGIRGTFDIGRGIARNKDLRLSGSLMRLNGGGEIELPRRWIDVQGILQLGRLNFLGLPVVVSGSWDAPKFSVDTSKLFSQPDWATNVFASLETVGAMDAETRALLKRIADAPASKTGISAETRSVLEGVAGGKSLEGTLPQ